jgi:hypothetical protein
MRMSHEGERPTDARIQDRAERAPPHWLNPLGSAWNCSYRFGAEIPKTVARNTKSPQIAVVEGSGISLTLKAEGSRVGQPALYHIPEVVEEV